MVIQHNMAAMFNSRELNIKEKARVSSVEKLSSGYKINRAADDAAGLSISEKMRRQIRGLEKASDNIADGISLIQVADGALQESHEILQRMNELAVQAANDTNQTIDRDAIQLEVDDLSEELTRIAETTSYNNHIYPLAADWGTTVKVGTTPSVNLPADLTEVTMTFVNDLSFDVECDGRVYHPGESITIDHVLWYSSAKAGKGQTVLGLYRNVDDNNVVGTTSTYVQEYTKVQRLSYTFFSESGGSRTSRIWYPKTSDICADAEGYLYVRDKSNFPKQWWFGATSIQMTRSDDCLKASDLPGNNGNAGNNGTADSTITALSGTLEQIHIQSGSEVNQSIEIPLVDARASALGVEYLDVMTYTYATKAITTIQNAIDRVSSYRSMFGAYQNRLEHAQANVDNTALNTQDAESKIRDTDIAEELVRNSTASILSQAGQSMLAQAQQMTKGVLQLLEM